MDFLLKIKLRDTHFVTQNNTNPQNKQFVVQEICYLHSIVCNSGCLDYIDLPNFLRRDAERTYFAGKTEKCRFHCNFKAVENLDDRGCPKIRNRDIFDPKADEEIWICLSYPFRRRPHFTVQSAKQNCLVTGQCSICSFILCIVKCVASIYVKKSLDLMNFFPSFNIE